MKVNYIIEQLESNTETFRQLLEAIPKEEYLWKPQPEKWCLLEVVCHLYDEEREDFRARLKQVLDDPEQGLNQIDPEGWVAARKYIEQDYDQKLNDFLTERELSVDWLRTLHEPKWDNAYIHPKFGPLTAAMFFANWLAHDYLHIRQIIGIKHAYLKEVSGQYLKYAGDW